MNENVSMETYMQEIVDTAASEAMNKGNNQDENSIQTTGFLINLHKEPGTMMHMIDQHHWSGNSDPIYPFPPSLYWRPLRVPPFMHQGPLPGGSVAGVVYADGHGSTARKWLVAFDTVNTKVYVEAGPMGPVDWNVVKVKLDRSGSRSEYEDPILGGKAIANYSKEVPTNVFAFFQN